MAGTIQAATIPNEILTVYAREAILQAQPMFIFKNFVEQKTQLGVEPGNTIRFLKLNNISKGGRLPDEMTPVPRQTMTSSTVELRVYEFANSIQFTRFAASSSYRDLMEDAALQLGRDYALVIDEYLRDIYLNTANVQWATGKTMDSLITAGGIVFLFRVLREVFINPLKVYPCFYSYYVYFVKLLIFQADLHVFLFYYDSCGHPFYY